MSEGGSVLGVLHKGLDVALVAAVAGAFLLVAPYAWGAPPDAENQILALEEQRIRAMIAGDLDTLDRILADDLTYVHSSGQTETKMEFLARLKSGDLKYRSMPREEVTVRFVGCAAVVTGRATAHVESRGETLTLPLRFTDVYVKRAGRWQMMAWQSSRIQ